jgi:hypothetical protein
MGSVKKKEKSQSELRWEQYFAMQLTPEQKAEARAELIRTGEEARKNGVYEALLRLRGKVHFTKYDKKKMRRDRD